VTGKALEAARRYDMLVDGQRMGISRLGLLVLHPGIIARFNDGRLTSRNDSLPTFPHWSRRPSDHDLSFTDPPLLDSHARPPNHLERAPHPSADDRHSVSLKFVRGHDFMEVWMGPACVYCYWP
jgi:hypothetical protein